MWQSFSKIQWFSVFNIINSITAYRKLLMFWCDRLLKDTTTPQVINDSKTPSGRVHVGSLRGVLIHDVVFRTLINQGVPVRYLFGVDDYDPVDEILQPERMNTSRNILVCRYVMFRRLPDQHRVIWLIITFRNFLTFLRS